jgi:hypothetical protein
MFQFSIIEGDSALTVKRTLAMAADIEKRRSEDRHGT